MGHLLNYLFMLAMEIVEGQKLLVGFNAARKIDCTSQTLDFFSVANLKNPPVSLASWLILN